MKNKAIILVDPVSSGSLFKSKVKQRGFEVICLYTMSRSCLLNIVADIQNLSYDADKVIFLSDLKTVKEEIDSYNINVVAVIPATEPGVIVATKLAIMLNCITNDPLLTEARRDKSVMKKEFIRNGVQTPDQTVVFDDCNTDYIITKYGFPLVVKTPRGAGSDLVFICKDKSEMITSIKKVIDSKDLFGNATEFALIEEYAHGDEYIVNLFHDGLKFHVIDVARSSFTSNHMSKRIMNGCEAVDFINYAVYQPLIDQAIAASLALGIKIGSSHVELKYKLPFKPQVIEVGARLPGAGYPKAMILANPHLDLYDLTISVYLNGICNIPINNYQHYKHLSCVFLHPKSSGIFSGIIGLNEVQNYSSFLKYLEHKKLGTIVTQSSIWGDAVGQIYLAHSSVNVLTQDLDNIKTNCLVEINTN